MFRGGKQIGLDRNRIQQGAKDKEEVAVNILDVLGNTRWRVHHKGLGIEV